jgi:hypothetical protein
VGTVSIGSPESTDESTEESVMSTSRLPPRRWLLGGALAGFLLAVGCDDDRGPVEPPSTGNLDGDGFYNSALISAYLMQATHEIAVRALDAVDRGLDVPEFVQSCTGPGTMSISLDESGRAATMTFLEFVVGCDDFLPLVFNGQVVMFFEETDPGLRFTVRFPFNHCDPAGSQGLSIQVPAFESLLLKIETPGTPMFCPEDFELGYAPDGVLTYELDGTRASGGRMDVTGTVRIGDEDVPFLIIEELALEYDYDEGREPVYADWPGGAYEIAMFGSPVGGFQLGFPASVFFDGAGGVTFVVEGRTCNADMLDPEFGNPCEDL